MSEFRSLLEQSHARVFTQAGLPWEYEPESIRAPGVYYQPDFLVAYDDLRVVVEVKGEIGPQDAAKCMAYTSNLPRGIDSFIVSFTSDWHCDKMPWIFVRGKWLDMYALRKTARLLAAPGILDWLAYAWACAAQVAE